MYSYAKVRYTNQSSIRENTFELNGKYQVMPNLLGGLAFIYSDGSEGGGNGALGHHQGHEAALVPGQRRGHVLVFRPIRTVSSV